MLDTGDCNSKAVSLQSSSVESGVDMSLLPLAEKVAAFKFFAMKKFCDKTTELNGDGQKFSGKCISLQPGLSGIDINCLEISNSLILSDTEQTAEVTNTESSSQASVSDGSLVKICSVLQSLDANTTAKNNEMIEYDDVKNLFQLLDKTEENKKKLVSQGPLFSQIDLSSSDDTSLFSLTNQFSSSVTDCSNGTNDFSFSRDFTNDRMALNEMFCSFLTASPGRISPLPQKFVKENGEVECIMDDFYSDFISGMLSGELSDRSKSSSVGNTQSIKRHICDSEAPTYAVPALKKRLSSSWTKLLKSKVRQDLTYSLNQRASEELKAAAARSSYVGEFAKFIQSSSGKHSDCLSEQIVAASRESVDSQEDSMHLRSRLVRKPVCACCRAVASDSFIPKQRCARKHVIAKRRCNVTKQSCAKSRKTYSHAAFFEQLCQLQIRIFHLLNTLFPFIGGLVRLTPHSHSLELLLHEIINILKDSSHAPNQKLKQNCCPVVSLCCSPEQCIKSLRRKTVILIQLLLPSVCHGCTKISELEEIIDQIIIVNK